jgi:hypothetical protein
VFWIFDPNLIHIYKYLGQRYHLVYDCVDFFASGSKENIKMTLKNESDVCKSADLVVANSHVLVKHLKRLRKDVFLVPQGFRLEDFAKRKSFTPKKWPRWPIIGFVGAVSYRLDFTLLLNLAVRRAEWNFVIWGPKLESEKMTRKKRKMAEQFFMQKNVFYGSSVRKGEIPGIISNFDICMIPYDVSYNFNKYCFPMKFFEYLYFGKLIVSTDIKELELFSDFVKIGKTVEDWEIIIRKFLLNGGKNTRRTAARQLAMNNSWNRKVEAILLYFNSVVRS